MARSGTIPTSVGRMVSTQQLAMGFTDQYELRSSYLGIFPTQGGRDS